MLISPAFAQSAAGGGSLASFCLCTYLCRILLFLIRPQQRRKRTSSNGRDTGKRG